MAQQRYYVRGMPHDHEDRVGGPAQMTIEIPTETGQLAVINFEHDTMSDTYTLRIVGALFDQQIECVTAAVQLAFLTIKSSREQGRR